MKYTYHARAGTAPTNTCAALLRTVIEIMTATRGRVPRVEWLMDHFGMGRATAYRWRRAFIDAGTKGEQA